MSRKKIGLAEHLLDPLGSLLGICKTHIFFLICRKNPNPPQNIELPFHGMTWMGAIFSQMGVDVAFAQKPFFLRIESNAISAFRNPSSDGSPIALRQVDDEIILGPTDAL